MEQKKNMVKQYAAEVNKNVKLFLLTQGGHTWFTRRDNLYEIAPMLFR